jgi:acyl-CoA hydrolase
LEVSVCLVPETSTLAFLVLELLAASGRAMTESITHSHRLILPADANHHGTLYAGSLLRITLEAAYATAWRHIGPQANLVLRRVLNLECLRPVPVGAVVELQGVVLHQSRAYLVVGLLGSPLRAEDGPWLEALLGFAQVDETGRPAEWPVESQAPPLPPEDRWRRLFERLQKLLKIR